jgi:hypothetical protein
MEGYKGDKHPHWQYKPDQLNGQVKMPVGCGDEK